MENVVIAGSTRGLGLEMLETYCMMLTEFITKSPTGEVSSVTQDKQFRKIFNTLGDEPETVAKFFIPRILSNKKQDAHIVWLTNMKSFKRFMFAPLNKRELLK